MGFVNAVMSWTVLAMGIGVPMIAILDADALTEVSERELERNGVEEAERDVALRSVRRFAVLGVCGAVVFGVACLLTRMGHGNAGLAFGVPGVLVWRWALARADWHADRARRAARAANAEASQEAEHVAP